jgi:hypothetical protein
VNQSPGIVGIVILACLDCISYVVVLDFGLHVLVVVVPLLLFLAHSESVGATCPPLRNDPPVPTDRVVATAAMSGSSSGKLNQGRRLNLPEGFGFKQAPPVAHASTDSLERKLNCVKGFRPSTSSLLCAMLCWGDVLASLRSISPCHTVTSITTLFSSLGPKQMQSTEYRSTVPNLVVANKTRPSRLSLLDCL